MQKTPLQCQVTWLRKLIFYINLFNLTDLWCSKDHFSLKGIIIVDDAIQDDRHWSYSTTTIVADKAIKYKFFIFFLFYSLIFLQISLFTKMIPGNYDMPTKCLIADQICQCNKKKNNSLNNYQKLSHLTWDFHPLFDEQSRTHW